MLTEHDFITSLGNNTPPKGISQELLALWYDAKGNWEMAHNIAQDIKGKSGAHIHAYLHRKEGDLGNAEYWYARAGVPVFKGSLEAEWHELLVSFVKP